MVTKDDLRQLVETLPEASLPSVAAMAARRALERLREVVQEDDPFLQALMEAEEDDEPLAPEDEAALREAQADITQGRTVSWEEARLRLGLNE